MSRENVEVVIGIFEAVNARDFAAGIEPYVEDATLAIHGDVGPLATTVTGKGAVGEWFGDWFRQFEGDYRLEINEARDCGDRVFLVATHHGQGRVSGVPVSLGTPTSSRCAKARSFDATPIQTERKPSKPPGYRSRRCRRRTSRWCDAPTRR